MNLEMASYIEINAVGGASCRVRPGLPEGGSHRRQNWHQGARGAGAAETDWAAVSRAVPMTRSPRKKTTCPSGWPAVTGA